MNKNQNWRRVLSLLFAMVMLVSIMVVGTVVASAEETDVASVNGVGYPTLAAALEAAASGNTVNLLADVQETVTVGKNVTIDGNGKTYTGTISLGDNLNVTVKNVKFENGGIQKTTKSAKGKYTVTNCTFEGNGTYAYPLLFKGANVVTVEDCTVNNYLYSFLYVSSSANTVKVKNVTVENCPNYAVYFASGVTNATFENLTVKNSNNGFIINNTATRSLTVKNCVMENVGTAISEANGTYTVTCTLLGANDFGTAGFSQYAKVVLGDVNSSLKTDKAELALNLATALTEAGYVKTYANGVWFATIPLPVVEVNNVEYYTIQEAIDAAQPGDTVKLLQDVYFDGSEAVKCGAYGYANLVLANNKQITFDFNGYKLNVKLTAVPTADTTTSGMLISVFFVENGSELTFVDSSEEHTGGINVEEGTYKLYCMIYNSKATVIIKSGNYVAEVVADSLIYADKENNTQIQGGFFHVGNYTTNKPWVSNVNGKNEGNFVVYTGGTFNHNPLVNFGTNKDCEVNVPDGYVVVENVDGTWSVIKVVIPVAEVNGVVYGSIQEAIDAAQPGDTVKLLQDVYFDGSEAVNCGTYGYANLVLADNKQITFDFNGYTLNVKLTAVDAPVTSGMLISVFFVQNGSELTFVDSSEEHTGGINVEEGTYKLYCMIYNSKATVIIKSGNYVAEVVADSLIYADKENNTQIQGGFFHVGNYTTNKPWVSNVNGKNEGNFVVYTGGTFNHNPLVNFGTNKDCEVEILNGCTVIENEDGTWTIIKAVAKVGDKYFETLKEAMDECNKAAGEYTITLVANVNEVFSFAQKSGVKITIDGNDKQFAFYGKITLTAGKGELVFANAVVEPKNSQSVYIAEKTAPNVTFVNCDLIGTNRTGTIVYNYTSNNVTTKITVKDCHAEGLNYIISFRQGGCKVHVENVTATNMAYVLRTLKCSDVYVKDLTATDVWVGIEIRNDGKGTLTLENVHIEITKYNGEYIAAVNGTLSNPTYATFNVYVNNCSFAKDDGTSFEKTEWFTGNAGYKVIRNTFTSANLLLNDKVGIYFNLGGTVLDSYVAVITNKTTGETWTVPATEWNGNKILVTLTAKQMADELTVVIKWGDREISDTVTTSISTYYKNGVDKGIFSDKDKALLEAMLHYGAQAQKAFGHNTDNLANAGIAAVQNVTVENKMEGERYYGASLNLEDHVIFNFKFFAGGVNADYAVVTFADGSTKRVEFRDENGEYLPEILERNSANVLLYVIKLDDIDLADVADDITCTIYWAHGEGEEDDEAIHTAKDSVLSYCARAMEGLANMKETNEEKYNAQKFKEDFYQALANYVAAVKDYADDYTV